MDKEMVFPFSYRKLKYFFSKIINVSKINCIESQLSAKPVCY